MVRRMVTRPRRLWGSDSRGCGGGDGGGDLSGRRVPLAADGVDARRGLGVEEAPGAGGGVDEGFDGGILTVGVVGWVGHGGEGGRGDDFGVFETTGWVQFEIGEEGVLEGKNFVAELIQELALRG